MPRNVVVAPRFKALALVVIFIAMSVAMPAVRARSSSMIEPDVYAPDDPVTAADEIESVELAVDDGSYESSVGLTLGGTFYAVNRLTPPSYPAILTEVKITFHRPRFAVGAVAGDPLLVVAGKHESGSDSIDLTTLETMDTIVPPLDVFATFDMPDLTINSGDFVVGYRYSHPPNRFPISLDSTTPHSRRSYVSFNGLTYTHIEDANLVLVGNFPIRAKVNLVKTCSFSITPTTQSFSKEGGTGSINLTSSLSNCSWNATTAAEWITLASAAGTGNGAVGFTVSPNSGGSRSASINAGGQIFTIMQSGLPLPTILNVVIQGKKLLVLGENFDAGARILIDGANAKKVTNDESSPTTLLVAKKAGKSISRGQTVTVQVENATKLLSAIFSFTRPL